MPEVDEILGADPARGHRTSVAGWRAVAGILGVDVGGTKVAARLEAGGAVREASAPWPAGGVEADLALLAALVADLVGDDRVDGVGVAMPATTDPAGRLVAWPGRPSWTGLDLPAALGAALPRAPMRWADDGDLAALAESAHAGVPDLVYLGVGTGVGGGIVLGGRVLPGPERGSCELGHLVVDLAGPVCDCGRRGCLQALASGPAIMRAAGRLRGAPVDAAALRAAWECRDGWAETALTTAAAALATAIVGAGELVRPALGLVGGGFAAAFEGFVELVASQTAARGRPGHPAPPVRAAALGGLSSLYGAVELAREVGRQPGGAVGREAGPQVSR